MHYAGLIVTTRPEHLDALTRRLRAQPEVQVHYIDHLRGRLVAVQEANDEAALESQFAWIRALPDVMETDLAYHFVDDDAAMTLGWEPSNREN